MLTDYIAANLDKAGLIGSMWFKKSYKCWQPSQ